MYEFISDFRLGLNVMTVMYTKQRATGELLHSKCIGEFVYDFKLARYDFKLARYDCYVYEKVWSLKHFWRKVKK